MRNYSAFVIIPFILSVLACNNNAKDEKAETGEDMKVEYIEGTSSLLGEGSIWDYKKSVLYWIDIEGMKLFQYDPAKGTHTAYDLGQNVGTVVPESENSVILALRNGLYRKYFSPSSMEFIDKPSSLKEDERFNDGKCDPAGRLWVGTKYSSGETDDSYLYKYEPSSGFTEIMDSVYISNGIVWSVDETKMYYIDTPTRKVMQYDFDNANGTINNGKIAIEIADSLGYPDGMTIDADGKLWIGMWGGNAVCRFDPDTGKLIQRIEIPARNVTSCAFGGENLDILYITTTSIEMNDEEKAKYPNAGGLFKVKPGIKGVRANFFTAE